MTVGLSTDAAPTQPAYDPHNIFARILRGELPCHAVLDDACVLAMMDVMPRVPGHVLVVPRSPCRNLLDAPPDVLATLLPRVQRVGRAVMAAFEAPGLIVQQFNEVAAGQTVFHLHVHLLPRHDGVPLGPLATSMAEPEMLAEHARRIRDALAAA